MWFLPCEYSHIQCKSTFTCKNLLTVSAWIWSLPCMYLHMISKMTSLYKSFLTMAAFMWFLPSMYLDMLCKIRFFVKSLLTKTALMWFFPCVYLHMHYKCIFPCKNLLTGSALVWSIPFVKSSLIAKSSHNAYSNMVPPPVCIMKWYFKWIPHIYDVLLLRCQLNLGNGWWCQRRIATIPYKEVNVVIHTPFGTPMLDIVNTVGRHPIGLGLGLWVLQLCQWLEQAGVHPQCLPWSASVVFFIKMADPLRIPGDVLYTL